MALILAEVLNDETVMNVISNVHNDFAVFCMITNSNIAVNSNIVPRGSDINVTRTVRNAKHKRDNSDDKYDSDPNTGFVQVKSKSKKSKNCTNISNETIAVKNSFSPLENQMDVDNVTVNTESTINTDNVSNGNNKSANKRKRIEPFWVQKEQETQWRQIVKDLNSELKTEIPMMDAGKFVKLYPQDDAQFRAIQKLLLENKLKFFAVSPQASKPFKIVIKGIPSEIPVDEVKDELKRLGFDVLKVAQLRRFRDKSPLPIFQVHLYQSDKNKKNI